RRAALSQVPVALPGLPAGLLDGPVELEAPVGLDASVDPGALDGFPGALEDEDSEHGGLFRRRSPARTDDERPRGPRPPRGRPVGEPRSRRDRPEQNGALPSSRPERDGLPSLTERRREDRQAQTPGTDRPYREPATPLPSRRRTSPPAIGSRADGPGEPGARDTRGDAGRTALPPLPARRRGDARPATDGAGGRDR